MSATLPSPTRTTDRSVRVSPLVLAAVVSVVAALIAVVANVVIGIGEAPLVIGTLVVASVAGWTNLTGPRTRDHR